MIYIGIDNGLNGAIVGIDKERKVIYSFIMPVFKVKNKHEFNVWGIVKIFDQMIKIHGRENISVILEQAHVRPISGKRACFTTGFCFGMMQGILESLKIRYEIISPREWQSKMLRTTKKSDTKALAILLCQRNWPTEDWKASTRCKKPHDGLCDAGVMALYGFNKYTGFIK